MAELFHNAARWVMAVGLLFAAFLAGGICALAIHDVVTHHDLAALTVAMMLAPMSVAALAAGLSLVGRAIDEGGF